MQLAGSCERRKFVVNKDGEDITSKNPYFQIFQHLNTQLEKDFEYMC